MLAREIMFCGVLWFAYGYRLLQRRLRRQKWRSLFVGSFRPFIQLKGERISIQKSKRFAPNIHLLELVSFILGSHVKWLDERNRQTNGIHSNTHVGWPTYFRFFKESGSWTLVGASIWKCAYTRLCEIILYVPHPFTFSCSRVFQVPTFSLWILCGIQICSDSSSRVDTSEGESGIKTIG